MQLAVARGLQRLREVAGGIVQRRAVEIGETGADGTLRVARDLQQRIGGVECGNDDLRRRDAVAQCIALAGGDLHALALEQQVDV